MSEGRFLDCLDVPLEVGDRVRVEFGNTDLIGNTGEIFQLFNKMSGPSVAAVKHEDSNYPVGVYLTQNLFKEG